MEKFIVNPANYKLDYIKNLNECFNGWGGSREYEWVFDRKVGEISSDILLIQNEEDGIIAGSGISYRKLKGKGKAIDIGIMTGSWTLPAARKKGCFTKMIQCSSKLCMEKDVPFLTAFVTETNPSSRRLEAEGSFLFPTYHLFSPELPFVDSNIPLPEMVAKNEDVFQKVFKSFQNKRSEFLNFSYTFEEFSGQYLYRMKETTVLKIDEDYAILEDGVNEVKILFFTFSNENSLRNILKAVTNWCIKYKSLKSFFFTTRYEIFKAAEDLNFEVTPGYFTILRTTDTETRYSEVFNSLNINMADKM